MRLILREDPLNRTRMVVGVLTLIFFVSACSGESDPLPLDNCEGEDCPDAGTDSDDGEEAEPLCDNSCFAAFDGECDDGGIGADYNMCEFGTDCNDCGPRDPDAECVADCSGRSCGRDGCGGLCEPGCGANEQCSVAGQCVDDSCVPECGARICGADPVCGLSCGTCTNGQNCTATGTCECTPDCSGRVCGDNGCGGICGGGCGDSEICNDEGQCELGLRSWDGATAKLRLIVGDSLGNASGRKVCIYSTDNDSPYLVLNDTGHSSGDVVIANADYIDAPAGVELRVSHHFTVGLGDAGTQECDPDEATPLGSQPLIADDFYTLVARTYDVFFEGPCASNDSADYCEFYPRSLNTLSEVSCATQTPILLHDGYRTNGSYSGGVRVANFTNNASIIASSFESGNSAAHGNFAGGTLVGSGYDPFVDSNLLRICPAYVTCDPNIEGVFEGLASLGCTDGESEWLLAETTNDRFVATDRNTTVYVFGSAGKSNAAGDEILQNDLFLVIAHDISEGALP